MTFHYTTEEEALLESMAGNMPYPEISRYFNIHRDPARPKRSPEAVKQKLRRMGLQVKPTEDSVSAERLAELLRVQGPTIRRWFRLGLKATRPGRKATARIRLDDVTAFLRKHPDKLLVLQDDVIKWLDPKLLKLKPKRKPQCRPAGDWIYTEAFSGISAPKKWLLAQRLGMSPRTLYGKAKAGKLKIIERRIA